MTERVEQGSERRIKGEGLNDEVFARLVVMKQLATQEEVENCLRLREDRTTRGERPSVASILVEQGVLTRNEASRWLEYQAERIRVCPVCDSLVESSSAGREHCPSCGTPLFGDAGGITGTSVTGISSDERFLEAETILRDRSTSPRDPFAEGPTIARRRPAAADPIDRPETPPSRSTEESWGDVATSVRGGDDGPKVEGGEGAADETVTRIPRANPAILKAVPISPDDPEGLIGKVIAGCEITSLLGKGGMGAVYRARRLSLKKTVALKLLPQLFSRSPDAIKRFLREARSAGQLRHPNIVEVYNVGEDQGYQYIEMEFIDGQSFREVLEEKGRLPAEELLRVMEAAARAMEVAHREGVIHRDIKPDNVMITHDGHLKVTDFGLARGTEDSIEVTRDGQVLGTPHYMSPEQCEGNVLDHRSDIHSLGVTFYHMATGRRPFTGDSAVVILRKHISEPPPPLRELVPDLPAGICGIIEKMMKKEIETRYPAMADLILDIERVKLGRDLLGGPLPAASGARSGGWTIPIGAILTVGLAAAVFAHAWGPDVPESPVDRTAPMPEIGREPPFPPSPPSIMESAMEEAAPPAAGERIVKESPAEPPEAAEIAALGVAVREAWRLRARAVPSGEYEVGTTEMEINRRVSSEFPNPLRKVSLPAMEISEFEVTNDEYVLFVEAGGYDLQEYWSEEAWRRIDEFRTEDSEARAPRFWPEGRPPERRGSYPVVGIGFDEAVAYCAWLSGLHPDLAGARLPTEEEWEVAASWDRSKGRKLKYPWGDGWLEGRANICTGEPLPVGSSSFDRSTFGCQDMAGNVREWVTGKLGRPVLKGACFLPMIAPETMARSEWHLAPRESDNFRYRRSDFTGFRVALPSRPAVSPGQEQDE